MYSDEILFYDLFIKSLIEKKRELGRNAGSHVALVVKNPPANAGDVRDVGSIPG